VCCTYSEAHVSGVVSHDVKQTTELVALVDFQLEALVFSNVGIMTWLVSLCITVGLYNASPILQVSSFIYNEA
jgi:hypothetical protein